MNDEQIYDEEDVLEDETPIDDDSSSDQSSALMDKLERVEALLNEDIALREGSEPELVTSSGSETVSGNEAAPNYSQYIYDLLLDGSVTVQVIKEEEPTIFNKQLNDYTVSEAILVIGLLVALGSLAVHFIEKYVFKYRK